MPRIRRQRVNDGVLEFLCASHLGGPTWLRPCKFHFDSNAKSGYKSNCKICVSRKVNEKYKRDKFEKLKNHSHEMTAENGPERECAICGITESEIKVFEPVAQPIT